MIAAAMITQCAPHVAPATIRKVIEVESAGDPLAVHVNGKGGKSYHPDSLAKAMRIVQQALKDGHSVDIGLMQVNTTTAKKLDTTSAQLFNPCTNLAAGAAVLTGAYKRAADTKGEGQHALQAALSAYNTGDFTQGFQNGYVAHYYPQTAQIRQTSPYGAPMTVYRRPEASDEQTQKTTAGQKASQDQRASDKTQHGKDDSRPARDATAGGDGGDGHPEGHHGTVPVADRHPSRSHSGEQP